MGPVFDVVANARSFQSQPFILDRTVKIENDHDHTILIGQLRCFTAPSCYSRKSVSHQVIDFGCIILNWRMRPFFFIKLYSEYKPFHLKSMVEIDFNVKLLQ